MSHMRPSKLFGTGVNWVVGLSYCTGQVKAAAAVVAAAELGVILIVIGDSEWTPRLWRRDLGKTLLDGQGVLYVNKQ